MPYNITSAANKMKGITLMPTYGLNVYSMLKHNTLVLTSKSLEKIESNLLFYMNNVEHRDLPYNKKKL
jgi:large subunit ribosomal protein L4